VVGNEGERMRKGKGNEGSGGSVVESKKILKIEHFTGCIFSEVSILNTQ